MSFFEQVAIKSKITNIAEEESRDKEKIKEDEQKLIIGKKEIDDKIKRGELTLRAYSMDELLSKTESELELCEYENNKMKEHLGNKVQEVKRLIEEVKNEDSSMLKEFYDYESSIDSTWMASKESQILFGKIDFLSINANHFSKDELIEIENYFTINADETTLRMFNKNIRWIIRKSIQSKADGLFTQTEFYYIDWKSEPFILEKQTLEELERHLKNISEKINDLTLECDSEKSRLNLYNSIGINNQDDTKEINSEIIGLKAAYSNIERYIENKNKKNLNL